MPRKATRPKPIIWFERLSLGAVVIGAVASWLNWYQLIRMPLARTIWFSDVVVAPDIVLAISALLALRVSLGRSKIAKWLLVGFFVLTAPGSILAQPEGPSFPPTVLSGIQLLGQLAALALLFTRPARRWLSREADIDLHDIFA